MTQDSGEDYVRRYKRTPPNSACPTVGTGETLAVITATQNNLEAEWCLEIRIIIHFFLKLWYMQNAMKEIKRLQHILKKKRQQALIVDYSFPGFCTSGC